MSVFFSGTDTQELMDNSEFHNYYLSLIVNNRNHMVAQVAFREKLVSNITTDSVYRDLTGAEKIKTSMRIEEKAIVNIYECSISKPYQPDSVLTAKYETIKSAKDLANKIKAEPTNYDRPSVSNKLYQKPEKNWKQDNNKNNPFDNLSEFDNYPKKNNYRKEEFTTPELFPISKTGSAANPQSRQFLIDLIGKGVQNQTLKQILGNLDRRMRENRVNINNHLVEVCASVFTIYKKNYPNDIACKYYDDNLTLAIAHINSNYIGEYPVLAQKIIMKLKSIKISNGG